MLDREPASRSEPVSRIRMDRLLPASRVHSTFRELGWVHFSRPWRSIAAKSLAEIRRMRDAMGRRPYIRPRLDPTGFRKQLRESEGSKHTRITRIHNPNPLNLKGSKRHLLRKKKRITGSPHRYFGFSVRDLSSFIRKIVADEMNQVVV